MAACGPCRAGLGFHEVRFGVESEGGLSIRLSTGRH